eukprot:GHVL01032921.1.p2 GENE.GHVL01032921.1~~GHVL01032921.1.p2  ORF type:complete len:387 (+),score=73.27 GHVL01032921.1:147-1307(+)
MRPSITMVNWPKGVLESSQNKKDETHEAQKPDVADSPSQNSEVGMSDTFYQQLVSAIPQDDPEQDDEESEAGSDNIVLSSTQVNKKSGKMEVLLRFEQGCCQTGGCHSQTGSQGQEGGSNGSSVAKPKPARKASDTARKQSMSSRRTSVSSNSSQAPRRKSSCCKMNDSITFTRSMVVNVPCAATWSTIFKPQKPESRFIEQANCVALPNFFTQSQCRQLIKEAKRQGFDTEFRSSKMNFDVKNLLDENLSDSIWTVCGLQHFMKNVRVEGASAVGLSDVIQIQRFRAGCFFGHHIDESITAPGGRISRFSIRVFLNGCLNDDGSGEYTGGESVFYQADGQGVKLKQRGGMAIVYPQSANCFIQEEAAVDEGEKFVLRGDILYEER